MAIKTAYLNWPTYTLEYYHVVMNGEKFKEKSYDPLHSKKQFL